MAKRRNFVARSHRMRPLWSDYLACDGLSADTFFDFVIFGFARTIGPAFKR
jgi:hypothetical protein